MINISRAAGFVLAAFVFSAGGSAQNVVLRTDASALVLDAKKGKKLKHVYYGGPLADADIASLHAAQGKGRNAYPDYGMLTAPESAIAARHADGDMTLDLRVDSVFDQTIDGATVKTVRLRDNVYPFTVDVNYHLYPDDDIIETWTTVSHNENGDVDLTRFASSYLPVRSSDGWLLSFYGNHCNEAREECRAIPRGMTVIKNRDGVRNTHYAHPEVMISLDGKPRENDGRVIGAALEYTGNYKLRLDYENDNVYHFFAGINEDDSPYTLSAGEILATPRVAYTYSSQGLGGASRNYHSWARKHKIANAHRDRKILLNSWEGVYFDINEEGMKGMMEDIAAMGGELFVMDDGWFGVEYPRNDDKQGLGDWKVNPRKLPHGIKGLLSTAKKNKIGFGIWIEPEMVNERSELAMAHPDWIWKSPNRERTYGRGGQQMNLDMANPQVQDFVFNVVDTLLTNYPDIDYIKWDANNAGRSHGSQYLAADRQNHVYINYHKGLENVLRRIRAKYPDVTIQACAGGGGRVNYGLLPYFDEFWTSDNTDALQRVFLQWGTSYFYPAIAMACHVSSAKTPHTQRVLPPKFRCDVAMSGRMGLEMQPKNMTDFEKKVCRQAIADYKIIRPVVQHGDLYRLLSPYDDRGAASLMYVAPAKERAVFYWYKLRSFSHDNLPRVPMAGLDADRTYRVTELNRIDTKPLSFEGKTFSGRFLMDNGLEMPAENRVDDQDREEYSSRVLLLQAID